MIIAQRWYESERGWGTRSDGYSFHLTDEDRQKFIKKYQDGLPDSYVPETYSFPSWNGGQQVTNAPEELLEMVKHSDCGVWLSDSWVVNKKVKIGE